MFYFWRLHTLPVFLCLALLVLPSFLFIIHSIHSHQKVTAGCMNGVSWPQRLPCITNAFASGWTIGSPGKRARNAGNGPVDDKKEISLQHSVSSETTG